jgi:predicted DCC family thiol-disulfide oxidoreductase YuxK
MPIISEKPEPESAGSDKLTVYYDGACPKCVRDRKNYEKLSGEAGAEVCWFDITGQESYLQEIGINPHQAISELHVRDVNGKVISELDAYIVLMNKVPLLKPVAWFIGLPLIRPFLAKLYHLQVNRRLRKRGII